MNKLPARLQHLTDGLPADTRPDIEEAIATSPYLQQRMTQAIEAGQLEHIRLTRPGANEGGHYDSREKAIYVSADTFTKPELASRPKNRIDVITSTLGHETGHALNARESEKTLYFVTAQATEEMRAAGPGGSVDVTPLFAIHQRAARRDEAMAEIEGWNALASRIQHTNGGDISRGEMIQRARLTTQCVKGPEQNPTLARGIVLDQDMQMTDTRLPKAGAINVEPVAQCHFDQSARSLGAQGKADYRNYYGAYLIEQIGQDTTAWIRPPLIKLDMAKLGLDPAQLESTGLNLGGKDLSLVDTSQQLRLITLRHTGDGRKHTPDEIARQPERDIHDTARTAMSLHPDRDGVRREPASSLAASPAFSDPDHPQHALYSTLKAHLPDYTSEPRLSQFTAECHLAGITPRTLASIHVEGERATFSTQWGWPRADVDMSRAPPPVAESLHRTEAHGRGMQEQAPSLRASQQEQAPMMAR